MSEPYPELRDPAELPSRVLCVAPHPDDETIACGGLLAFHAERGDVVRILVLTDGAAGGGGPDGGAEAPPQLAEQRRAESLAAAEVLGLADLRFLGFGDGELGRTPELVEALKAELEEFGPELVYAPAPSEVHADHRAAAAACASALMAGPERQVLLYGVNRPAWGVLFDTTRWLDAKYRALARFESQGDLTSKARACDRANTVNMNDPAVLGAESFAATTSAELLSAASPGGVGEARVADPFDATAVISNWNKLPDLRENLAALRAQTRPFHEVVVVDNASSDGSAEMVAREFPEVRLVIMPHSAYGACETFNIGFATARSPLIAILDDDVVLPPEWLERSVERLRSEPASTAILSTEVIEPGMPESFRDSLEVATERYMSTFRGCASLARAAALHEAGGYDERLFIYGNERDLTCRLLNLGYRVLHYPAVRAFHKTPFGIKLGKRSLYYHARNAWLTMLKYAPLGDLIVLPWLVVSRVLLRGQQTEAAGGVSDAVGTIGIGRSVRETPGAWWVLCKAAGSVLYNVPYCLKHRKPVKSPDFELPLD